MIMIILTTTPPGQCICNCRHNIVTHYVGLSIKKSITDLRVASSGKVKLWGRWLQAGQSSFKNQEMENISQIYIPNLIIRRSKDSASILCRCSKCSLQKAAGRGKYRCKVKWIDRHCCRPSCNPALALTLLSIFCPPEKTLLAWVEKGRVQLSYQICSWCLNRFP